MDFKHIHIGQLIETRVKECGTELTRICNFLKCTENDILAMYALPAMHSDMLLKWSKLLEYDFFRIYSQHLVLYAPVMKTNNSDKGTVRISQLPRFRKHVYTMEIIVFILHRIISGEMTKAEVMERYRIPKTTLYKWLEKYSDKSHDR